VDQSKFAGAQDGFERYLPAGAIDVIEHVQPFRTRNVSLSVLRTLSNQDRHGFLSLTVIGAPAPEGPAGVVALKQPKVPQAPVDVLHKVLRHISVDVLPKFEPLLL